MYQIIINGITLLVKAKCVNVTKHSETASTVAIDDGITGLSFMVSPNSTIKLIPPADPSRVPPPEGTDVAQNPAHDYRKQVA